MQRRWRLFPKYALLIMTVVGGLLIVSGAIGVYFSWRETEANLVALQEEKAESAAARIEQYIVDIAQQISWAGLPPATADRDALEERKFEYTKLLKQVSAITEVAWIDGNGREQLRISRIAMNTIRGDVDMSRERKFRDASAGKIYYGPVYFRKGTEPYLTIARPAGGGGVTAAEVNLKFVWDVVSRIRIGEKGSAHVIDAEGSLIAHPDISLVLRKTDLSALPQVAALRDPDAKARPLARGIAGDPVLSAHAAIPTLHWTVFVESPEAEAFAPLYASIVRAALLLGAGLLIAIVASFYVARALVRPLQALQQGAAQIGAGELDRRIEVRTGDELEGLAEQFNQMGAALRESYAGLERKVEVRTAELSAALEHQTATAEVLRVISGSVADSVPVFEKILESCDHLFASNEQGILLFGDDGRVHLAAHHGHARDRLAGMFPSAQSDRFGDVLRERGVLRFKDVLGEPDVPPGIRAVAEGLGIGTYSQVFAPMVWEDRTIGTLYVTRSPPTGFADKEVELLRTFAHQAVIAIQNARLFNETKEALERQTATAEVLRVISASVTQTQPVFDVIAERAVRLMGANLGFVFRFDGDLIHMASAHGVNPQGLEAVRKAFPMPPGEASATARAVRDGVVVNVGDVFNATAAYTTLEVARSAGYRAVLAVPMLREREVVGAIVVTRAEPGAFPEREVDLLRTFASQAVIAIENVRLFNETKEALEQQIATSDVLRTISNSVADPAPVFDSILAGCERLFGGNQLVIFLVDDQGRLALGATRGPDPERSERMRRLFPVPLAGTASEQAIRERRLVTFADVLSDPDVPDGLRRIAGQLGETYAVAIAPMLWEGRAIGSIMVGRTELRAFDEKEQRLLRTFAEQAVIAIQNARLFNETKEALERQTATAEVLQVISGSLADTQPVFDRILSSCERLFNSTGLGIFVVTDDGMLRKAAFRTKTEKSAELLELAGEQPAQSPSRSPDSIQRYLLLRAIRECRLLHHDDVLDSPDEPLALRNAADRVTDYSIVIAPMLRAGHAQGSGALVVLRDPVQSFTARELELIRTFADQAVIAIQNARLFNETKEALEQQTATAEVLQVISSSVADTQPVFDKILDSCAKLFAATGLGIYLVDAEGLLRKAAFRGAREKPERALGGTFPRPVEGTATERAIRERRVVHYPDVLAAPDAPESLRRIAAAGGTFSIAFAPMLWEGRGVGAIQVSREPPQPFSDKELALLKTFADQAVIAIQNARLFEEIQAKSRELEKANRHKSEFLANMSHELRTPLNAIIGFSEVLSERMFGELNEKQLEYLLDIHTSGQHLLSLINDILDLSKIEAGRMELDLATTSLPMLLDNCTTLVRERANRQGLILALDVEPGLGDWVADVRKLKQVVINLLANAVKFTPAGGRVTLRARRLEHAVEVAVVDTGVGIAADQQALVFEEFRQAGGDYLRKSEGTGLGLSLAKRFVELHGGTIRVESAPGKGSTFAFILPERVLEAV